MKKVFLYLTLIASGAAATAAPLSPRAALDRARADAPARVKALAAPSDLKLCDTKCADGQQVIYIFNDEKRNAFLLVGADDALPATIGYGSNLADAKGLRAPGFEYWLDALARQAAYRLNTSEYNTEYIRKERPQRAPIAPLLDTEWGQSSPYNKLCPRDGKDNTVTGCVATAMAQTMKYFNWPDTGEGEITYNSRIGRLTARFDKWDYDWEHMLPTYYGDEETAEWLPVARLMYLCGYSVQMNYSTSGSGAASYRIAPALGTYFKYDKGLRYLERDYFTLDQWESMIYDNLANVGPIIYDGQSYEGGHSFVCDGYDEDGFFHFNWGWEGLSDGYYILDALDPIAQGIGGSASGTGFNFMQDIVLGIKPDKDGSSSWSGTLVSESSLDLEYLPNSRELQFNNLVYSGGPGDELDGLVGYKFTPINAESDAESLYSLADFSGLGVGYGFAEQALPLPDLDNGAYRVKMVYAMGTAEEIEKMDDSELGDVLFAIYDESEAIIRIDGQDVEVEIVEVETPQFVDAEFDSPVIYGHNMVASGRLVYNGPSQYLCFLQPILINEEKTKVVAAGYQLTYDLDPGSEMVLNYNEPFSVGRQAPADGDYYIAMSVSTSDGYFIISDAVKVRYQSSVGVELIDETDADGNVITYSLSGLKLPKDANRASSFKGVKIIKSGNKLVKTMK